MPLPVLSPKPSHLLAGDKEGDGKGGKSDGDGVEEGDGNVGNSNGDSNGNEEGEGKGGKRNGDGD
jgi:hypothetical protein